jgi:hypothetical protein
VDEGRKRVLLIAAAILAARKLSTESVTPGLSPRAAAAIDDAVVWARRIMDVIDRKFPVKSPDKIHD